MSRYQIWDKVSTIYTPVGEALTAEEWIARYGWINIPTAVPVVSAGMINGGFSGELNQMKELCIQQGATFENGLTNEQLLAAIEAFEDYLNTPSDEASAEERIAAALEYQVIASMPDETE